MTFEPTSEKMVAGIDRLSKSLERRARLQDQNKNLGAWFAEMESRNPSLRTRAGIVRSYGYEPVMDKVSVDFETNQPAYKLRVLAPSYRRIDNDCDGVVDDYKPSVDDFGIRYSRDGQLFGHDGATADRPRRDKNLYCGYGGTEEGARWTDLDLLYTEE